jgi:predicted tellurium resistance membrane protein TerC
VAFLENLQFVAGAAALLLVNVGVKMVWRKTIATIAKGS